MSKSKTLKMILWNHICCTLECVTPPSNHSELLLRLMSGRFEDLPKFHVLSSSQPNRYDLSNDPAHLQENHDAFFVKGFLGLSTVPCIDETPNCDSVDPGAKTDLSSEAPKQFSQIQIQLLADFDKQAKCITGSSQFPKDRCYDQEDMKHDALLELIENRRTSSSPDAQPFCEKTMRVLRKMKSRNQRRIRCHSSYESDILPQHELTPEQQAMLHEAREMVRLDIGLLRTKIHRVMLTRPAHDYHILSLWHKGNSYNAIATQTEVGVGVVRGVLQRFRYRYPDFYQDGREIFEQLGSIYKLRRTTIRELRFGFAHRYIFGR